MIPRSRRARKSPVDSLHRRRCGKSRAGTHTCWLKLAFIQTVASALLNHVSFRHTARIRVGRNAASAPMSSSLREAHDTYGFSCVARSDSRHPGLGCQRAGRPAHPPLRQRLRPARLQRRRPAHQAAARRLQGPPPHDQPRRAPRRVGGRRRRGGRQGLGPRARRDPLHALVPAAHRHHRREARRLPRRPRPTARPSPSSAARN